MNANNHILLNGFHSDMHNSVIGLRTFLSMNTDHNKNQIPKPKTNRKKIKRLTLVATSVSMCSCQHLKF